MAEAAGKGVFMDVVEFQKRLQKLCSIAEENGQVLSQAQIRDCFQEMELETEQMVKMLQYLKTKGIQIQGAETEKCEEPKLQSGTRMPLTAEEKAYLQEYLNGLLTEEFEEQELLELFQRTAHGDALALGNLAQVYLPVAANMAAEMNCEEIHLADLIQEANVALLEALEQEKPQVKNDQWLRLQLRKGILAAIEEQTERKFQDDSLVARVEKLESAVKELTDDDGETRFTLDELAVILDMKTDEIRDVLRLTGDDK